MARKLVYLAGAVTALMFSFTASAGTTLWHTFTTSQDGGTTYRVSTEGNVYSIESPTGYEHVYVGSPISEGYVLCYSPANLPETFARDIITSVQGFHGATHSSVAPFTVSRTTADGRLRLKQVFTFNATSKSLNIVMTITNLTGSTINNIVLNRLVDTIVDGGGANGFASNVDNSHAATNDAVSDWNDPDTFSLKKVHGLVLRHLTQSAGVAHYGLFVFEPTDCHSTGYYGPFRGGPYPAVMHYSIPTLAAGASKSVTIQYMRD